MDKNVGLLQRYLLPVVAIALNGNLLAPVAKLALIPGQIVDLMAGLKVPPLTAGLRHAFPAALTSDGRDLSQIYQRFLVRRPDYATATSVDAQAYQQVLDLDAGFAVLQMTLGQASQLIGDGQLILNADVSQQVLKTGTVASVQAADASRPEAERATITRAFLPLQARLDRLDKRDQARKQDQTRRQRPLNERLTAAQQSADLEPQVARLQQAAKSFGTTT